MILKYILYIYKTTSIYKKFSQSFEIQPIAQQVLLFDLGFINASAQYECIYVTIK